MTLSIPDELLSSIGMSDAELLQELAILLFQKEKLTLAQASRLAAMPRLRFQQLLASRHIPIHYDVADLEADVETLRKLGRI